MSEWRSLRENFRQQLVARYKADFGKGILEATEIRQMIKNLETALERARRTHKRVIVQGQEVLGSVGTMEIEDQISALREVAQGEN